jgi:hypothetical protein
LYYDIIKTAIIGDFHHIKIILDVPLKTANCQFLLYKILALPIEVSNGTFVQYTGCNRRNGPDFGRVFLMLNYTEKPQNTYIQS